MLSSCLGSGDLKAGSSTFLLADPNIGEGFWSGEACFSDYFSLDPKLNPAFLFSSYWTKGDPFTGLSEDFISFLMGDDGFRFSYGRYGSSLISSDTPCLEFFKSCSLFLILFYF